MRVDVNIVLCSHIVGSPGVVSQLCLEDSFFDDVEDFENTQDVQEKVQSEKEERENKTPQLNISKESSDDMFEESSQSDSEEAGNSTLVSSPANIPESQPDLSLPLSFVDVRARVLEELKMKATAGPELKSNPQKEEKPSQISRLVKDEVDRGPFFGLPSRVAELYQEVKGVKELFDWQVRCLKSQAVKSKSNLLYSLPTSGGKTLVAEIIMLQELFCYKRNVLFILPFVSIVQEKIKALTPFALALGFYLEEYAGPKGRFPPIKRRHRNTLYVCTIEKAHALFNSLVAEGREKEVGLMVIDEVHMLGEGDRGANLESLLVKSLHVSREKNFEIQLVAMSATVGNLKELAVFLQAELFTDNFRPVELEEFVKVDSDIVKIDKNRVEEDQFKFLKKVTKETDNEVVKIDPDGVTDLVLEVFPGHSVLLFCDTKKRCENVADMLVRVISLKPERNTEILHHREEEKRSLLAALQSEGGGYVCPVLRQTVPYGVAYHHSGLTMDERKVLEEAFLAGILGVLCCTSTLAAGVNLPARQVIIRSPYMGRNQLTNTQYKQMVGRAGRAGLDTQGESFLLVKNNLTRLVPDIVTAPVEHCLSRLSEAAQGKLLSSLVLNCLQLGLIKTLSDATRMLSLSLLSVQRQAGSLSDLLESSVLFLLNAGLIRSSEESDLTQQSLSATTVLESTKLGRACVSGNIDLSWAASLYSDLSAARPGLAVDTSLHLLYLVTPYDLALPDRPVFNANNFHAIYERLKESETAVARNLGISEGVMVGLVMGRQVKKQTATLNRFYYALMLLELWQGASVHAVADRFQVSRGEVQSLMSSAASFSASVFHFCQEVEEFWAYQELLEPFSRRLAHCCSPELLPLLDLPGVKIGRAKQLHSAGLVTVADISKSKAKDLVDKVEHLSYKAATSIIQAAKLIVTEKAEALRDEAEMAMLDLSSQ